MNTVVRVLSLTLLVVGLGAAGLGCGTASPSPTAAPKAQAQSPTAAPKTQAAPQAEKPTFQWVGDKLQPLADGFPNKAITLYSGFQAGHNSDIYLRLLAEVGKKYSPVAVVADNRVTGPRLYWDLLGFWETLPGNADGYLLGETSVGASSLRSLTVDIDPYALKDVNFVIGTEFSNHSFGVRANDDRFKTIQDFVQYAKASPNKVKIGSSSVGSQVHLDSVMLGKSAGFDFTYVPHTGAAQSILTLLGNGVDMAVAPIGDFLTRPDTRVLLLTGSSKAPSLSAIPTAKEVGYNIPLINEEALFTSPKVTSAHRAWLFELFKKVAESPEYEQRLAKLGATLLIRGPEELRQTADNAAELLEPIMKELGLHKDQVAKK